MKIDGTAVVLLLLCPVGIFDCCRYPQAKGAVAVPQLGSVPANTVGTSLCGCVQVHRAQNGGFVWLCYIPALLILDPLCPFPPFPYAGPTLCCGLPAGTSEPFPVTKLAPSRIGL